MTVSSGMVDDRRDLRTGHDSSRIAMARICDTVRHLDVILWFPVSMAAGICLYFSLDHEPHWPQHLFLASLSLLACVQLGGRRLTALAALALAFVVGFYVAMARANLSSTPKIGSRTGSIAITGWLENIDSGSTGRQRMTIRPTSVQYRQIEKMPFRIRVSGHRLSPSLMLGQHIEFKAVLFPPTSSSSPSAFDFARLLYFKNIGAVGYLIVKPRVLPANKPPLDIQVSAFIGNLRHIVTRRITATLAGSAGALVAALSVGNRSLLKPEATTALRDSGLAHLLAISGLHMAIVIGTLFWIIRAILALSPRLALSFNIKKIAAAISLLAGLGYLLLSGGSVSTLRAFIMFGIMAAAILFDRPAITMRNLALAAIFILTAWPESVLTPGFQMSFLTVMGLVAANTWRRTRAARRPDLHPPHSSRASHPTYIMARYLTPIIMATLIATILTGPVAIYHFQRIALYGVAANLLAIPVTTFLLMPAIFVSVLAMPIGLETGPLLAAGWSAEFILLLSDWISQSPGAVKAVAGLSTPALLLFVLGSLWICLWQSAIRMAGIFFYLFGALYTSTPGDKPLLLASNDGGKVAIRSAKGKLVMTGSGRLSYAERTWLRLDGDGTPNAMVRKRAGWRCDKHACAGTTGASAVTYIRHPAAIPEACSKSGKSIVISKIPLHGRCTKPGLIIGPRDFRRFGAHAVYDSVDGYRVEKSIRPSVLRLWTPM